MKPPNPPTTLAEFLWYCMEYKKEIFFRAQKDGRWQPVSLEDLSPKDFGEKIAMMIEDGGIPCRILRDEEINP